MLIRANLSTGVTLIELVTGLAIFAGMLALAGPSMTSWIQNGQIRTSAMAIQNGMQIARATAVQRNAIVSLFFTTTLDNTCVSSVEGSNWVVSLDDPSGHCATPPDELLTPRIVQARSGSDGSRNAVVAADQSVISFNGLGRLVNGGAVSRLSIDIQNTVGGSCLANGGTMRCLRVVVSQAGQVRMCDPAVASSDVRAC
jgi:type IV fimbrial biogenesis protein FimT